MIATDRGALRAARLANLLATGPSVSRTARILQAIAGFVLLWLCLPPSPLGFLLPIALVPLFRAAEGLAPRHGFLLGFAGGLLYNALSLHWIRNVMAVGPAVVIGLGLLLLLVYLSVFNGLWLWAYAQSRRSRWGLFAYPFLWAGLELFRTWGEMSFPWSHIAYGFGGWLPFLQGASLLGVFGTGIVVVAGNLVVHRALAQNVRWKLLAAAFAFWVVWGGAGWMRLQAPSPAVGAKTLAIVQPAIPQTRKWEEEYFQRVVGQTFAVAARVRQPVDLWLFPETAIPDFWSLRPDEAARLQRLADSSRAPVLLGALDFDRDAYAPRGYLFRNSAFYLAPGTPTGSFPRYDKLFLVPFSERLPFDDVFPIINFVDLGEGDFVAGRTIPIYDATYPFAPSICYELVYPKFVRMALARGARMLVNLTNDGWFGRSAGPYQHWNIQRFRAIESGLPLVRAANTGISGALDYRGVRLAESALMADTALVVRVPLGPVGGSFYARHGVVIDGSLAVMALLAGLLVVTTRGRAGES